MKNIFFLLLSVLITQVQIQKTKKIQKTDCRKITYSIEERSGKLEGKYQEFLNGELIREEIYKNGKLSGPAKTYLSGRLYKIEYYKNGKLTGPFFIFYPTGKLCIQGFKKDGKRNGIMRIFKPNETEIRFYRNDKLVFVKIEEKWDEKE